MGAQRITPDQLDGLEKIGIRFGWRACLTATGEPLSDDGLRSMLKQHAIAGGERAWTIEHFVDWPQPQDAGLAQHLDELRETYERYASVRRAFAAADSQRTFEKWIRKAEGCGGSPE